MSERAIHRQTKTPRRFRLRILLALGLLVGCGATITLASWNTNFNVIGSFTSSTFGVQQNVNNAGYVAMTTGAGSSFTLGGAFSPGVVQYFPVSLQTTQNSIAGTATLGAATLGGNNPTTLGSALTYSVVNLTGSSQQCGASAFAAAGSYTPNYMVGTATTPASLTTGSSTTLTLPAATSSAPGAAVNLCFQMVLPSTASNSLQGQSATATWQFTAVSS